MSDRKIAAMSDCTTLRIALSLNVQHGYARETMRGILDAAMPHQGFGNAPARRQRGSQQWQFQLFARIDDPSGHRQLREMRSFAPHGIIYENLRLQNYEKLGCTLRNVLEPIPGPKVELYPFCTRPKWPAISSDDLAVGRLAAEHFQGLGLRHFAFFGDAFHEYSRLRRVGFNDALRLSARPQDHNGKSFPAVPYFDCGKQNWRDVVRAWVGSLQLPVGIFAANDFFATELLQEMADTAWKVPEEIAVLGVDNDDLLCHLAHTRISSIVPGFRQVGRAAVGVLAQLFAGNGAAPSETFISPMRVVTRQSTDILHVPDAQVAAAIQYIRSRVMDNISVKELVQKVPGNRRRLEKRFFGQIGRTLMEEIHRVRIAQAKLLLSEGKSVEQTAYEMHFSSPKYFATLFHRVTGLTPSEFKLLDYQALIDKPSKIPPTARPGKRPHGRRAAIGSGK